MSNSSFCKQKPCFLQNKVQKNLKIKFRLNKPACWLAGATNRGFSQTRRTYKKRTPTFSGWGSKESENKFRLKKGDDILSHITAVPSAQAGLTTLFGMGRGEPRRNNHLKRLELLWAIIVYYLLFQEQSSANQYLNILR